MPRFMMHARHDLARQMVLREQCNGLAFLRYAEYRDCFSGANKRAWERRSRTPDPSYNNVITFIISFMVVSYIFL